MGGRQLSEDEKRLWQRVAHTVRPLRLAVYSPAVIDKTPSASRSVPGPNIAHAHKDLRPRNDKQTRRGRVVIDVKIDLHDFTRDQAYEVLVRRIKRAYNRGFRCALVVTGKGKNLEGVLRMSLAAWLSSPELRPMIANYAQAHIRHGGSGAFYVFLKRNKAYDQT